MTKEIKPRQSNIELLRIVLMWMIIIHHLIVHGIKYENLTKDTTTKDWLILLVNCAVVMSVNTFLFISGYFGIQIRIQSLLSLLWQATFYSVTIGVLFHWWKDLPFNILFSALPVSATLWWYLTNYIALFLLSPLINKGVEYLTNTQLLFVLSGLFYFNCIAGGLFQTLNTNGGYSFFSFVFIYVLAKYLNKNGKTPSLSFSIGGYIVCVLLLFLIIYVSVNQGRSGLLLIYFAYNNPLIILMSIFFFYTFKQFPLQNGIVNVISTLVFGVYLIHDHYYVREYIMTLFISLTKFNMYNSLLLLVPFSIVVLCLSALLEWIRLSFFKPIIQRIMGIRWIINLEDNLKAKGDINKY